MCDVFVQPTFEDCFPLTIIEAMQHHLPVVSTTEGAIRDMVRHGENTFICGQNEVNSLVYALEKLISQPHISKKMGEKGFQYFKQNFTLQVFELTFINKLKELIN